MSLAVLLAQNNDVIVLDIDPMRIDRINKKKSTVKDSDIELFLDEKDLSITATLDKKVAYEDSSFIIIATPTNYDPDTSRFDTSTVDDVVNDALYFNSDALIVIKSTIPVGHTSMLQKNLTLIESYSLPSFYEKGVHSEIIFILPESL